MFHAQKLETEKYGTCENLVKIPYFYVHVFGQTPFELSGLHSSSTSKQPDFSRIFSFSIVIYNPKTDYNLCF